MLFRYFVLIFFMLENYGKFVLFLAIFNSAMRGGEYFKKICFFSFIGVSYNTGKGPVNAMQLFVILL